MDNIWSATTSTLWISFCPVEDWENRCSSISGTENDNIVVYVKKSTSPSDEEEGTIKIHYNGNVIIKTIKRCLVHVLSEEKTLTFRINGQSYDTPGLTVGPCKNGSSSNNGNNINISNIVLTTVQTLETSETIIDEKAISPADVNAIYTVNGNSYYGYLPSNLEADRLVTLTVEYKLDPSVKTTITLTQIGIKNTDGTYNEDVIIEAGYSDINKYFDNFDFVNGCKTQIVPCRDGYYDFYHTGLVVTDYGGTTGKTICGDYISIKQGRVETTNIPDTMVTYSVNPSNAGVFDGNRLHYYQNNSTEDKILTITATAEMEFNGRRTTVASSTTFTVQSGAECGGNFYIHITSDISSVDYVGGSANIRYYISEYPNDDETFAISDPDMTSRLELRCPGGVNCGIKTEDPDKHGVFTNFVTIPQNRNQNGSVGQEIVFSAMCDNKIATLSIYQSSKTDGVLPNGDYFTFDFDYDDIDGKRLESYVVISTKSNRLKDNRGNNVSDVAISDSMYGENGSLFVKFGRNVPICKEALNGIVCLKNIRNSEGITSNDEIYVDVYANWYEKRINGNIRFTYDEYKGKTTEGGYSDEIIEAEGTCEGGLYHYYTFLPNPSRCDVVEGAKKTINRNVASVGPINKKLASNVRACLPNGAYTHILRLTYNVSMDTTTLRTYPDNGIDTTTVKRYIISNGTEEMFNIQDSSTGEYIMLSKNVSREGEEISLTGTLLKIKYDGDETLNYVFGDGNELFVEVEDDDIDSYSRRYTAATNSSTSLGPIENLKVTNNPTISNSVNISFRIPELTGRVRRILLEFRYSGDGIMTCGKAKGMINMYQFVQN